MKESSHESVTWHQLEIEALLHKLNTNAESGLDSNDVINRQQTYGTNKLSKKKSESHFKKFFKQFHDVLIYVLLIAAIITTLLGQYIDTTVILLVVIINAVIGFVQENRAEQALNAIRNMLSLHANVIRNGHRHKVDAEELVVGDIILLRAGDKVPADARIIKSENLTIEESALTGESLPVEKKAIRLAEHTALGDRVNMAYSSTSVVSGTGVAIVVAIGNQTEIGKINQLLTEVEDVQTPMLKQTARFGKQISLAIVGFGFFMFLYAYFFRNYELGELVLSIIAMIVAAIPEGLPAIMSIILAIGVQSMAKKNAIVRNLPSVETLGSVSVICSDKTGTLTKNEMTVQSVITKHAIYDVTGTGYEPIGNILKHNQKVDINHEDDLMLLLLAVQTANDSVLTTDKDGNWIINGEPTDGSLMTLAKKGNKDLPILKVEANIPFDSEYKYMASLAEHQDEKYIFIKGAPDRIFDMATYECSEQKNGFEPFQRILWEGKVLERAKKGERVIGVAYKKVAKNTKTIDHVDLQDGVVFLGLTGIIDPPREEVIQAIKECRNAGIDVKMVTGDHPETASAIGKMIGIGNGHRAIEGREIDRLTDEELVQAAKTYDIFARTSPNNKLQLVEALQSSGDVVSMTGDGVNDAPSLKKADIGVAMGIKGTEAAKDASEMVLVDDNFKTIVDAVEEGRRVYDNLKKTILFILPTNGAEAFLVAGSILFGLGMVLTPVQILWVNMITAITISMALAFEQLDEGAMNRPPRSPKTSLLSPYYVFRIIYVSLIVGLACLYISIDLTNKQVDPAIIKTIVLNGIVFAEMFYLFNARNEIDFAFNKDFFKNRVAFYVSGLLILFEIAITYIPFFNTALGTAPISLADWTFPVLLGLCLFVIVECEKAVTRMVIKYVG